jgi:integrase
LSVARHSDYYGNQKRIERRKQERFMSPKVPAYLPVTLVRATRAESDEALLKSWLRSLQSSHTQRNFEVSAKRFLAGLPEGGLRSATVEDVRDALANMSTGLSEASARQYVLRIKSLLGYAHALGYTPFNAGATIKVRSNAGNRGATLAKRIISEVEVSLLIRAAPSKRDRVLLEVIYAGGLRVSETVALTWADVLPRDERVQLSITGKGGTVRQVLLPEIVSRGLLSLRGDAGDKDPCSPAVWAAGSSRSGTSTPWSSVRPRRLASTRQSLPTGSDMLTARMPSTVGPHCQRFRARWATATSPPRRAICTPAQIRRADCTSIQGCSFNEDN